MCVDEKTQVQALDRTAPILPLIPGTPERQTLDYKRNGTTNLYAALDVASGKVITSMTARHRAEEFRRFLNLIDKNVPEHLDVHIVLDNVSTHKTPSIQRWLLRHPRFTLHFTPTYSSWLNLVERWFAELDHQVAQAQHPPLRPSSRRLDPHLGRQLERRPQALRLAQDRRRDPRQPRQLLPEDQRLRSLGRTPAPAGEPETRRTAGGSRHRPFRAPSREGVDQVRAVRRPSRVESAPRARSRTPKAASPVLEEPVRASGARWTCAPRTELSAHTGGTSPRSPTSFLSTPGKTGTMRKNRRTLFSGASTRAVRSRTVQASARIP